MEVRTGLQPGDLGEIIALHGRVYGAEHAFDGRFEADVARWFADLITRGFPRRGEDVWIMDDAGAVRGSIVLTDEGDGLGRVRFFILDPATRGQGLGHRLLDALLARARAHGYTRLELSTFAALRAAGHLYRSAGFVPVETHPEDAWGPTVAMQRYELAL